MNCTKSTPFFKRGAFFVSLRINGDEWTRCRVRAIYNWLHHLVCRIYGHVSVNGLCGMYRARYVLLRTW